MNIDQYYQRQKYTSVSLVSGNIKHLYRYSKALLAGASSNLSGVAEMDEFAVFPLPYLRSFRNDVGINCTLRPHTVPDFCRHQQGWSGMTLNARFNSMCVCRTVC